MYMYIHVYMYMLPSTLVRGSEWGIYSHDHVRHSRAEVLGLQPLSWKVIMSVDN